MEIVEKLSPNCEGRGGKDVIGIILHFTAGGDSEGTVNWFMNPKSKVSAHYIVSRSGKIIRMVREEMSAWHAGSSTTVPKLNGVKGLNQKTIGIEICNWGWLLRAEEKAIVTVNNKTYERQVDQLYTRLRNWTYPFKGSVMRHKVTSKIFTKGKNPFPLGNTCYHWETFNHDQLDAVVWLIKDILTRYPNITRKWIARHQDVDPTRKLDTGPAFPFNGILDKVFPEAEASNNYQIGRHEDDSVSEKDMEDAYETDRCRSKWSLCP